MAKKNKNKKKHPIVPKRKERLKQARGWLKPFVSAETRTNAEVIKGYRDKFRVDVNTAIRELQELGYEFKEGYAECALRVEEIRVEQLHAKKSESGQSGFYNDFQDDRFAYIADYTSGGAPYGLTWEESDMIPYEEELIYERAELEEELAAIESDEDYV